jgi:hypothetical protein
VRERYDPRVTDPANPFEPHAAPATLPGPSTPSSTDSATASATDPPPGPVDLDDTVLEALESDLAAVETAIAALDSITEAGLGGERAATEIGAAVSAERFGPSDVHD